MSRIFEENKGGYLIEGILSAKPSARDSLHMEASGNRALAFALAGRGNDDACMLIYLKKYILIELFKIIGYNISYNRYFEVHYE